MSWYIYGLMAAQLAIVAFQDYKYKKIYNYWSIINLLFFIVLLIFHADYTLSLKAFFLPLTILFVGFILFVLKIMGAGDSKYLFTFFLLIPEAMHEKAFIYLAYSTIIIGIILLVKNTLKNFNTVIMAFRIMDIGSIKRVFGTRFSYAPVILISWIYFGYVLWGSF